ncbi:hypothetical protein Tco_0534128 [Tanacetum coccineum]
MSYEECEKICAEAVIFINKRLVRLIDVTVEQWMNLKYGNRETMNKNVKKGVIGTWLIKSYKLQFEEYLEIKRQRETYAQEVDMEYNPSNLVLAEWIASKFYSHLEMDWYTKNALWVYWMRGNDETIDYGKNPPLLNIIMYHSHLRVDILSGQLVAGKMTDIEIFQISKTEAQLAAKGNQTAAKK